MLQMTEQGKKEKINETELTNLPDKEFKTMVIKIITGCEKIIVELKADLKKEKI